MGMKPKHKPSFFKVVVKDDFTHLLRLPPVFVEKYGEILPVKVKLKTNSGVIYKVKLEQIDEEYCCFTQGWDKFALDFGLKIGDLLVFWFHIAKSKFNVSVYGLNGCERRITPRNYLTEISDVKGDKDPITCINQKSPEMDHEHSRAHAVENDEYHSEEANPHFILVMKEHRRSRVLIRKEFAVAAGLIGAKAVVLKYPPEERHWPVILDDCPLMNQFRLEITQGWNEFWRKNGLIMGKSYLFEYIPHTNVIEVKLLDEQD